LGGQKKLKHGTIRQMRSGANGRKTSCSPGKKGIPPGVDEEVDSRGGHKKTSAKEHYLKKRVFGNKFGGGGKSSEGRTKGKETWRGR